MKKNTDPGEQIVVFDDHQIRRILHNGEWFFSIIDVIGLLTGSANPRRYWSDLKRQLQEKEGFTQLYEKIVQLKLLSADGKRYETDCANTESMFRIVQSIPSPRAEPFKQWLAKVGYERVREIEDPELASQRARELYKAQGYPDTWIEKRMRGIQVRAELTDEWKKRNVGEQAEYATLTREICKATFGITPSEYKALKGIKRENLRNHMTDLELIFTMLGEASTTEIARENNAQGFEENLSAAQAGGDVAGVARKNLESKTGRKVTTKSNYILPSKKRHRNKEHEEQKAD